MRAAGAKKKRAYGVSLVRGPELRLPSHPQACRDVDDLLELAPAFDRPLAADLFCGAGGLSLGLQRAGFEVVVGVDSDRRALETHGSLFPGLSLERDLSSDDAVDEVVNVLALLDVSLVAGGPPCQPFSRAGRSKIRSLVEDGARSSDDGRRDLWQSFLEVVEGVEPPAVLLENVPDMALGDGMVALRSIIDRLEALDYAVHVRLLDAWRYGVPQHRQRLILVALSNGCDFEWPRARPGLVTVRDAIGDLPPVSGGWRPAGGADGYAAYRHEPTHWFRKRARQGLRPAARSRIYDHITRPVRRDDARAFKGLRQGGTYAELDRRLKRYRDDIFDDKYKRLHANQLSRTITAHISRDGYWYIHPSQARTLTVREAARLQTFPDRVRFAGPPSSAFQQIGNAVPPLLAEVVGKKIRKAIERPQRVSFDRALITEELSGWIAEHRSPRRPWLLARRPWPVVAGELTLKRASVDSVDQLWPILASMTEPNDVLHNAGELRHRLASVGRSAAWGRLVKAARWLTRHPECLCSSEELARAPGVGPQVAQLAGLVALGEDAVIPSASALRVAARFSGTPVNSVNQRSDGRMAIGLMVGAGKQARQAHVALLELGTTVCHPTSPRCHDCPLMSWCSYASGGG